MRTVSRRKRPLRLLVVAPVQEGGCVTGDEQLAVLAELGFIARHELPVLPGRARPGRFEM